MSKMIIYFYLFIPLLFLSTETSSIRGRNNKNDLVPFLSSRLDTMKKDPNSLKIVSKDPFIIQLQMPNSKEMEAKSTKEKDTKKKGPVKKRVSKIKSLRKKHRKRRDLLTTKTKPREEKLYRFGFLRAANETETELKNTTRNSVDRAEILNALTSYPRKIDFKRNKFEEIRNIKNEGKIHIGKIKKNNTSNLNFHKHHLSLADRSKMAYPNTPKSVKHPQKYTYKDLMADRERLEQKIKYIKNMININDSAADDAVRVRRRSNSDSTANKIAKMFLTLSAVNGLHDRRKSKCKDGDENDDRVEDVWEKERRNNPYRKNTSSNEERYKVKKWIEFMKNKRSSGKICPCMGNAYPQEDIDAFPLEQKLPKGYFLMERGRSSEESSELYSDPFYYSKAKTNRNDNIKKRLSKTQDQEGKIKASGKNNNKKLETPFEDLELYRSRARQILQNAEEILDKIKEEEEKRLATPNILMSQLKELTSRIHGDPRNNENDLIRKIQKNLGWGPLARPQDNADGIFADNLKSFILDPYEKAKALTDESTKKLSSYLLRNLGRFQESSEEQEMKNADDKADDKTLKIYFEQVPGQEEKLSSANLAKEEPRTDDLSTDQENLQNWKNTLSAILNSGKDAINKENNWGANKDELLQQGMEDIIAEKQKLLNDYIEQSNKETATADYKELRETLQPNKDTVAEGKPESFLEKDTVAEKLNNKEADENSQEATGLTNEKDEKEIKGSEVLAAAQEKTEKEPDIVENKPFREMEGTSQKKERENNVTPPTDMHEEEEFEKKIEEIINAVSDLEDLTTIDEKVQTSKVEENEEIPNKDVIEENEKENERIGFAVPPVTEETALGEGKGYDSTTDERVGEKSENCSPSVALIDGVSLKNSEINTLNEAEQDSNETVKAYLEGDVLEPNEETILESEPKREHKQSEEEIKEKENKSTLENFRENKDSDTEKDSPLVSKELQKESEKKDSLNEEITQKETGAEFADLVKEVKQSSKEFSESNPTESKIEGDHQSFKTSKDENKIGKEETAKSNDEEITRDENTNGNLKAMFDNENNREDKEAEMIVKNSREESTEEDLNIPLKATLKEQEPLDNQRSSSKEDDDYALLKENNSEDQKNETMEDIDDETMKETLENKSLEVLGKESDDETLLESEKPVEDVDDVEKVKIIGNNNDEVILKESNPDEILENLNEEDSETPLKAVMNKQDVKNDDETQEHRSSKEEDNDENLDKDGSNETNLKSSWDKEDLEEDDDITLKANIPNLQERDEINKDPETLNSAKPADVGTLKENQENSDEEGSTETLVLNTHENQDETKKPTNSQVNENAENISDKDGLEETVRAQTPDDIIGEEETDQELIKALINQEMKNLKEKVSEETLKIPDESIQDEITENSDTSNVERLKADNQKKESVKEDELVQKNLFSDKPNEDENFEAVLENETQENLEEKLEETLKAVKLDEESERNLEATLENQSNDEEMKDETVLKEANVEESEENLKDDDHVEIIFNNQEQTDENERDLDEVENQKKGATDDREILLKAQNFEEVNNKSLKAVSNEQDERNLEESYENLQSENPEEDRDKEDVEKTLFRSASLEDAFDNKIEYETPLKSAEETPDLELIKKPYETENGETLRAESVPQNIRNQIDEESERESGETLRAESVPQNVRNQIDEESERESGETLRAESVPQNLRNQIDEESERESGETLRAESVPQNVRNQIDEESERESGETLRAESVPQNVRNQIDEESERESGETLRAESVPHDVENQIDEENENETILESIHQYPDSPDDLNESSYETVRENLEGEPSLNAQNPENKNFTPETFPDNEFNTLGDIKKPEVISKSLKGSKLKVPESIGKIMKDLEGKEKSDITSIKNLKPDKIDHMLDKIGEAEQQNQLESDEVDCKKECACAEEMSTRSRNIGRYEIVKDFLHWVKDLQLNRVLGDD